MKYAFCCFIWVTTLVANAQISMKKTDDGILITDAGDKVFFYQMEPKNKNGKYTRNNYIHPLWGVDGAVLTEDFPDDHLHHRGIFWAWHQVWIDGKRVGDPWEIKNFEQNVSEVEFIRKKDGTGVLNTEVNWLSDQWKKHGRKIPYLRENTSITIHPKTGNYRQLDFEIRLLALEKNLSIGGSEDEKGYSGFSVRMVLPDDVKFTGPNGDITPEVTSVKSDGFVNISGSMGKNGGKAGIVIADNPVNPGYPQPWILRAKNSMQNPAYPGNKTIPVSPAQPLVLKYSLIVYSGNLGNRKIERILNQ